MKKSHADMMQQILDTIQEPHFPDRSVNILDFGAQSDTDTCQTAAIQAAIDTLAAQGGGTVIVPSGRFLTGALHLKSGINLHLQNEDSTLLFIPVPTEEHYPLTFCHWEATPCYNFSPLIYAIDAHDIGLTGRGTLDGQSSVENWWGWHCSVEHAWSAEVVDLQNDDRLETRRMNVEGVPVEERVFGNGHYLRPNFVQPIRCERILLEGVTLKRSPMWQLNPVECSHITVRGMTLSASGPNSDGCDPESCNYVLIENCTFDTGDDCIAVKAGRDRDGRNASPCQNIVIRNNVFADGHGGIALGSEMSGGIKHLYADKNLFESPNLTYVLRFKTNARRGGYIQNIWLHDTVATAVGAAAVHATMLYEDGRNGDFLPTFSDICIENLKADGGDYGIFLEAFPEVPITGLVLRNIQIENTQTPLRAMNWEAPILSDVTINGLTYPRPTETRILGVPKAGAAVQADCLYLGGNPDEMTYRWYLSDDASALLPDSQTMPEPFAEGALVTLPADCTGRFLTLLAKAPNGETCSSIVYQILPADAAETSLEWLTSRRFLPVDFTVPERDITRIEISRILYPLCHNGLRTAFDQADSDIIADVLAQRRMSNVGGEFKPEDPVSRLIMATIAMQSCGVMYKNASTTMPVCTDVDDVLVSMGTNVARALYFNFMELDENNAFLPNQNVTWQEAIDSLKKVIFFAGY